MIRTTIQAKADALARRKAVLGIVGQEYVAPNSGARRTASKRQLLRTIEREARSRGTTPHFKAAVQHVGRTMAKPEDY